MEKLPMIFCHLLGFYALRHYLAIPLPRPHTPQEPQEPQERHQHHHRVNVNSILHLVYVQQVVRPGRTLSSRAIGFMHQRAQKAAPEEVGAGSLLHMVDIYAKIKR